MSDCFSIEPGGCSGAVIMLSGDVNGPSNANTVEKLQNRDVSSAAPSDGDALHWDASASNWEPGAVAGPETGTATFTSAGSAETITIPDQGGTAYEVIVGNGSDSDGTQYTCTLRESSKTNTSFILDLSSTPAVGKPVKVSWELVTS